MAFDPKEEKFLHSLPGGKMPAAPGLRQPGGAPVAGVPRQHMAPVTPHVMPVPGQKHVGPSPGRWDKLQQYLQRPAAPLAPVNPDESEVP